MQAVVPWPGSVTPRHHHLAEGVHVVLQELLEGLLRVGARGDVALLARVLFRELFQHVLLVIEICHHHRTRCQAPVRIDHQKAPPRLAPGDPTFGEEAIELPQDPGRGVHGVPGIPEVDYLLQALLETFQSVTLY